MEKDMKSNGEIWEQTLFETPGREGIGVYEIGSLEPIRVLSDRSEFVFTIPEEIPAEEYDNFKIEAAYIETSSTSSEPEEIPGIQTELHKNYPNPFNPETTISFSLAQAGEIKITIYNIKGQKVQTLVNDQLPTGKHSAIWNGTNDNGKKVTSGIYFYKLKTDSYVETKKMMMLK